MTNDSISDQTTDTPDNQEPLGREPVTGPEPELAPVPHTSLPSPIVHAAETAADQLTTGQDGEEDTMLPPIAPPVPPASPAPPVPSTPPAPSPPPPGVGYPMGGHTGGGQSRNRRSWLDRLKGR